MLTRNGFCRRAPKRLSRYWTCPSPCSAVARPSARVRRTLWKSERCIFQYVSQRECKHVCTCIQAHPYIYQQYLKSPTQILKESYTAPPTQSHPHSPIIEETVSPRPLKRTMQATLFVGLLQYFKTRRTAYIYEHI